MSRRKRYSTDAIDKLSARLAQAHAALLAIRNTCNGKRGDLCEFSLPPMHMENALWGICEQLSDAEQALEKLCTDLEAERDKNTPAVTAPRTRQELIQRMRETSVIRNDQKLGPGVPDQSA